MSDKPTAETAGSPAQLTDADLDAAAGGHTIKLENATISSLRSSTGGTGDSSSDGAFKRGE